MTQDVKAQHTPGPWQTIGTDPAEGGDWFWIMAQPSPALRGFTKEIGVVSGGQSDPVQQANARLIAAAPDLLEVLRRFVEHARVGSGNKPVTRSARVNCSAGIYHDARAVIAKATGETND